MTSNIDISSEQAKTLFWRMSQKLKEENSPNKSIVNNSFNKNFNKKLTKDNEVNKNIKNNKEDSFKELVSLVHTMLDEFHTMKQELKHLQDYHLSRQKRVQEIEERIKKSSSPKKTIAKNLQEIKNLEEQILRLESLHNKYSQSSPEHKESLSRIKEKIELLKKKLNKLKN